MRIRAGAFHQVRYEYSHHVVADCVSFATAFFAPSLIPCVAPPFQIEPAAPGFDLVLPESKLMRLLLLSTN